MPIEEFPTTYIKAALTFNPCLLFQRFFTKQNRIQMSKQVAIAWIIEPSLYFRAGVKTNIPMDIIKKIIQVILLLIKVSKLL